MQVRNYRGHWILPVMSVQKVFLAAVSHTEAEFEDIKAAYEAGFTHAAHFYNAMLLDSISVVNINMKER